jgi:hypothetical protein
MTLPEVTIAALWTASMGTIAVAAIRIRSVFRKVDEEGSDPSNSSDG